MRSSKYHDYRVLKVILFIVLVVLGLFIYVKCIKAPLEHVADDVWVVEKEATCTSEGLKYKACVECGEHLEEEVIPKIAHVAGKPVDENVVDSTCTVGGSHDEVAYCIACGYEISRETVQDEVIEHTPGKAVRENFVDSTHTIPGSYDMVIYCTECGAELSDHKDTEKGIVVPEKGHDYVWSVVYDEESQKILLTGECSCDEEGNSITLSADDEGVSVYRDEDYAPCCLNRYYISYTYYGKTVTKYIDFPLEQHKLFIDDVLDHDGGYVSVYQFALYDEDGAYFDYSMPIIRGNVRIVDGESWDDNGFRTGYFRCMACEEAECMECCPEGGYSWREVRLYYAQYDKSRNEEV